MVFLRPELPIRLEVLEDSTNQIQQIKVYVYPPADECVRHVSQELDIRRLHEEVTTSCLCSIPPNMSASVKKVGYGMRSIAGKFII